MAKASWSCPVHTRSSGTLILWGGQELGATTGPDFYAIGVAQALESPLLTLMIYIAGLSAASGLMIVSTLALAGMVLNHIVLPLRTPREHGNIYRWLRWIRRLLIAIIIFGALLFHETLGKNLDFAILGAIALSGLLQLLPGALGVIYWPEGNRRGLITGLISGVVIWVVTLVLPFSHTANLLGWLGAPIVPDYSNWYIFTFVALTVNITVFALVSILFSSNAEETSAAQACSMGALSRPQRRELLATSSEDFVKQLADPLGQASPPGGGGPGATHRPRWVSSLPVATVADKVGQPFRLLGPSVAGIWSSATWVTSPASAALPRHPLRGARPGRLPNRLTGWPELDNLRRHYRQTLEPHPCLLGGGRR